MAAATTTTPTRWCAAAIVSYRSTSMFQAARRRRKLWSTASCCCSGKSAAPATLIDRRMDLNELGQSIARALPGAVKSATVAFGELTLDVEPREIVKVIAYLRDDPGCE